MLNQMRPADWALLAVVTAFVLWLAITVAACPVDRTLLWTPDSRYWAGDPWKDVRFPPPRRPVEHKTGWGRRGR